MCGGGGIWVGALVTRRSGVMMVSMLTLPSNVMLMFQALALASLMSGRFVRSDRVAVSGSIDLRGRRIESATTILKIKDILTCTRGPS